MVLPSPPSKQSYCSQSVQPTSAAAPPELPRLHTAGTQPNHPCHTSVKFEGEITH